MSASTIVVALNAQLLRGVDLTPGPLDRDTSRQTRELEGSVTSGSRSC